MSVEVFTKSQIKPYQDASSGLLEDESIKIVFSPHNISSQNIGQIASLYKSVQKSNFDTFVIIEHAALETEKALTMPSLEYFETSFGRVSVDDRLRNDFADEEDDFFIDDAAYHPEISAYQQIMMLQNTLTNPFQVVSILIGDPRPAIMRELAWVVSELLGSRNACMICCCELETDKTDEFEKIRDYVAADNMSSLLNYVNGEESSIIGGGAFTAGLMVAKTWGLNVVFRNAENGKYTKDLIAGYAGQTRTN